MLRFLVVLMIALPAVCYGQSAGSDTMASDTKKIQLWNYINESASQDESQRQIDGLSYIVGGAAAIGFPFLATSATSPMRSAFTYLLVPAGIGSVFWGGWMLVSDSPMKNLRDEVLSRSGPEEDTTQWKLRRELNARQTLLDRADRSRFWRHMYGGFEAGIATVVILSGTTTLNILASGTLYGLSLYHLFYEQSDERIVKSLDLSFSFAPDGRVFASLSF